MSSNSQLLLYGIDYTVREDANRIGYKFRRETDYHTSYSGLLNENYLDDMDFAIFFPDPIMNAPEEDYFDCHYEMMRTIEHFISKDKLCFMYSEHEDMIYRIDDLHHNNPDGPKAGLAELNVDVYFNMDNENGINWALHYYMSGRYKMDIDPSEELRHSITINKQGNSTDGNLELLREHDKLEARQKNEYGDPGKCYDTFRQRPIHPDDCYKRDIIDEFYE